MAVGGILPFGAVFIELFFIMSSVWLQRFYYVFGFLALVIFILLLTCAEISIVLCYFQLCNEDYHWWWRSFLNSGAAGGYLLGYSAIYFHTQLDMVGFTPTLLYFGCERPPCAVKDCLWVSPACLSDGPDHLPLLRHMLIATDCHLMPLIATDCTPPQVHVDRRHHLRADDGYSWLHGRVVVRVEDLLGR